MSRYNYFSTNPAAAEVAFLMMWIGRPLNVSRIARELGKQPPSVHRVIQNLLRMEILIKNDDNSTYLINPSKSSDIRDSLIRFILEESSTEPMLKLIHQFIVKELHEQFTNLVDDRFEVRASDTIDSNFRSYTFDIIFQANRTYGIVVIDDSNKANLSEIIDHLSYLERAEVYAVFVLVFDRTNPFANLLVRNAYSTEDTIISLEYFNKGFFSLDESSIQKKISETVEDIKDFDAHIDLEEICSLLEYMSPSIGPYDSYYVEPLSKADTIREKWNLSSQISFVYIVQYITEYLTVEVLRNPRNIKAIFLQQVLGITRKIPNYYPPEYLFFDFCLAYLSDDYTDANLYLDHSKYLLGIPQYFRILLNKIVYTSILRKDKDIQKFIALLARIIQPMSANSYKSQYGEEYSKRYTIYTETVLSIDDRLLSLF